MLNIIHKWEGRTHDNQHTEHPTQTPTGEAETAGGQVKVINLFGGPGAGKSTTAAGLFWLMKNAGLRVELVTEYAKALAWAKRGEELTDQFYIWSKQHHRQHVLRGQVDYCITDSPLLLTLLYSKDDMPPSYRNFVFEMFSSYHNLNFFVNRVKPYVSLGRFQNEQEADELGRRTKALLEDNDVWSVPVDGNEHSAEKIFHDLLMGGAFKP